MTVNFAHVQETRLLILLVCKNHDCRLSSRARIATVDFAHVRESRLSTLSNWYIAHVLTVGEFHVRESTGSRLLRQLRLSKLFTSL